MPCYDHVLHRFYGGYKHNGDYNDNVKFPIRWTAPEALGGQNFTSGSDVWSFGVLMWEVLTYGEMPYPGMSNKELVYQVIHKGYRMENPAKSGLAPSCSEKLYTLMQSCWHVDSEKRPNFAVLVKKLTNEFRLEQSACAEYDFDETSSSTTFT